MMERQRTGQYDVYHFRSTLCLLLLVASLWPVLTQAAQFTGKVVGINEGDTLSVLRAGKVVQVRLYGVDCPKRGQAFSMQARQFTREVAFQQTVAVVADAPARGGRLLAVVQLPNGRDLSQTLVQAGYAWHDTQSVPQYTKLAQLEAEARAAQRGLWADAHPLPPWEWRKGR